MSQVQNNNNKNGKNVGGPSSELCSRKFFVSNLRSRDVSPDYHLQNQSQLRWRFKSLSFSRVWIQGYIRDVNNLGDNYFVIDDGTGTIAVDTRRVDRVIPVAKTPGMYVMVIGTVEQTKQQINAHKIVDLSDDPNREALWILEVIDLHINVYQ